MPNLAFVPPMSATSQGSAGMLIRPTSRRELIPPGAYGRARPRREARRGSPGNPGGFRRRQTRLQVRGARLGGERQAGAVLRRLGATDAEDARALLGVPRHAAEHGEQLAARADPLGVAERAARGRAAAQLLGRDE